MPVPNTIDELKPDPADNYPAGSEPVFPNLDDYLRSHAAFIAQVHKAQVDSDEALDEERERIEELEEKAKLSVQKTSDTGVALLPEGTDAQRPATGGIPAGALLMRGNTQDPADYWAEFWDRSVSKWRAFADRVWTGLQIDAAIQAVKDWVNQQIGFAIIYPNGGSAASPALVSINSRYVTPNPFPGFNVICVAEVLYNGSWGETGWMFQYSEGGRGVKASQSSTEGIIVQTGRTHLLTGAQDSGSTFPGVSPWNAPLQCRVKVTKVKGAV